MVNDSPDASSIPWLKLNLLLEDNHLIVLSPSVPPSIEIPPSLAVTLDAPVPENVAAEAVPDPPKVASSVIVVPLTDCTTPPEASVTVPPPLPSVIVTPGAILVRSEALVIVLAPAACDP